jgi:hypothetical protein
MASPESKEQSMSTQEKSSALEALRCKVELLEDRVRRQQKLIDGLQQQACLTPATDLVGYIYASTSRDTRWSREFGLPFLVVVGVVTWTGLIAWALFGK